MASNVTMLEFALPMPPTTNALFATFKGRRIITREYKAWKLEAGEILMQQYAAYGSPAIHKPMSVHIRLGMNYRGDVANREKACVDLMVSLLEMDDDRYIDRILIERDQSIEGAIVTVEGSYAGER